MALKDWSEKNGVGLFYSTIILAIIAIVLGANLLMGGLEQGRGFSSEGRGFNKKMNGGKGFQPGQINNNQMPPSQNTPNTTQNIPTGATQPTLQVNQ